MLEIAGNSTVDGGSKGGDEAKTRSGQRAELRAAYHECLTERID